MKCGVKMVVKNTSVSIPENILDAIKKYNKENPFNRINRAEVCTGALHQKLLDVGVKL